MSDIVQKLWGFCHTLRHDGVDYGDYIEQLTYLLFLKMADERDAEVPRDCGWNSLKDQSGTALTDHYADILRKLREQPGILGDIFAQSTPRFNNPVNLKRIIAMIDEEDWSAMDVDVKGAAFEGLLEKAASEGKKGAGQYFTPRPLIQSICRVMKPDPRGRPDFRICDPACGTGGFLVCAWEWLISKPVSGGVFNRSDYFIRKKVYHGQDLVPRPRRLALMNLFLHGVEPHIHLGDTIYEPDRGERYDVVLTNPPFGTKGANQAPERDDFTIETSNKQLNFVQHVLTVLKSGGRAALVLPDNCLFEGKAGEVFEILMQDCNLHTVLRLPRGTFTPYSQGVKANVIFLQKGQPTEDVWIFDARSNVAGITKKDRPLTAQHFAEFEKAYGKDPNGLSRRTDAGQASRFRKFHISEIKERGYKLDITWLKDESLEDSDDLPEPQDLAGEAITELEAVVDDLREIVALVEKEEGVEK
ncbi:MAG: N-6 DNA methylase [Verrucomicrobiales bacterium]|nr:N-6 DNA methylase [Verrucomicrobiales bacterium]